MADVEVDEIKQAGVGDQIQHFAHLQVVVAAFTELHAGHADADGHLVADAGADALQRFDGEADAVLRLAAPLVGAAVGDRREEAVNQRFMRAVNLDAIGAAVQRGFGGIGVDVQVRFDFGFAEHVRRVVLRADDGHG